MPRTAPRCGLARPAARSWPVSLAAWTTPNAPSPRPSGSCARTGARASATGVRLRLHRSPAPAAIPGSGTGTPASRRSSGGASTRPRSRAELESLLAAQRPDGFIGHTIFWDRPVSLAAAALLQRRLAQRLPDRDDPAAAAGLGLADRRRRPGRGAADRRPDGLARAPTATSRATACSGSSSPTSRASTPRRSSTRSGAGAPTAGSASRCWSARNRRLGFDARRIRDARRPGALRDPGQHDVVALAAGAGPALGDAGAGRAALGRAPRPLPRRGPAGRRPARRRSPGPRWRRSPCPTCRRRSAGAWSRSTCSNEREFLTPVAPPSVAASEPSYEPGGGRGPIRRYWRGPTWVNSAWMVWLGLRRLGYEEEARAAGRRR